MLLLLFHVIDFLEKSGCLSLKHVLNLRDASSDITYLTGYHRIS